MALGWVMAEESDGSGYFVPPEYVCPIRVQMPIVDGPAFGAIMVACRRLAHHAGAHRGLLPDGMPFVWRVPSDCATT